MITSGKYDTQSARSQLFAQYQGEQLTSLDNTHTFPRVPVPSTQKHSNGSITEPLRESILCRMIWTRNANTPGTRTIENTYLFAQNQTTWQLVYGLLIFARKPEASAHIVHSDWQVTGKAHLQTLYFLKISCTWRCTRTMHQDSNSSCNHLFAFFSPSAAAIFASRGEHARNIQNPWKFAWRCWVVISAAPTCNATVTTQWQVCSPAVYIGVILTLLLQYLRARLVGSRSSGRSHALQLVEAYFHLLP